MPKVYIECKYCGKRWDQIVFHMDQIKSSKCPKCGDKHLKIRKEENTNNNPFGYDEESPKPDAYIVRDDNDEEPGF